MALGPRPALLVTRITLSLNSFRARRSNRLIRHISRLLRAQLGFHFLHHLVLLASFETRAGRNEGAEDDVLFETHRAVPCSRNGCFGELARCVLEGNRGEEGCARKRYLGDAQKKRLPACGLFVFFFGLLAQTFEFEIRHDLARRDTCIAGVRDRDAAEHLFDNDFEMLARRRNSLQFINACDLADDVLLRALSPCKSTELFKVGRAVGQEVALHDCGTLLNEDLAYRMSTVFSVTFCVLSFGGLRAYLRKYHNDTLLPVFDYLGDSARNAGNERGQFGVPALEDLFDARQTHRDVAGGTRHTSGVEGAHSELSARLADSLRGDNAYRLPHIDELAGR